MKKTEILEGLLKASDLFKGLSAGELRSLARASLKREFRKGDIVFTEGSAGEGLFLLETGSVKLVKTTGDGREVQIRTVGPGGVFAEIVLFEKETYPVTATALQKSCLWLIPKKAVYRLLEKPSFRLHLIGGMMQRLRYLTRRILDLSAHDVEERLAVFLKEFFENKSGTRLTPPKKEIAAAVGTSPETLSRILLKMKLNGKITWQGKRMTIHPAFWKHSSRAAKRAPKKK